MSDQAPDLAALEALAEAEATIERAGAKLVAKGPSAEKAED